MTASEPHRKLLRRFHEPGDIHELTFSVHGRKKLLTNNAWRAKLSACIDQAGAELGCHLAAFVYMPEHVHLLVWGFEAKEQVGKFLSAIKQPFASHIRAELTTAKSRLLAQLLILERPGKQAFRFWQAGAGYDRNLQTVAAVQAALEYIHHNPVARGLCSRAVDWRWSSARHYYMAGQKPDPLLPKITPFPAYFWPSS